MVVSNPCVTIIMPAWNSAKYILQCLDSLKNQSFVDFECIIIDDGSTDDTAFVIKKAIAHSANFRLIQQPNAGVSAARNKGLNYARGKYVIFLDADDYFHKDLLSDLYTAATQSGADMTVCNYDVFDNSTSTRRDTNMLSAMGLVPNQLFTYKDMVDNRMMFRALGLVVWNKLIKRELLVGNKIKFNEGIHLAEDVLFVLTAMLSPDCKLLFIPKSLVSYRCDSQYNSVQFVARWPEDALKAYRILKKTVDEINNKKITQRFFDVAVGTAVYYINNAEKSPVHKDMFRAYREFLLEFGPIKMTRDDYSDPF